MPPPPLTPVFRARYVTLPFSLPTKARVVEAARDLSLLGEWETFSHDASTHGSFAVVDGTVLTGEVGARLAGSHPVAVLGGGRLVVETPRTGRSPEFRIAALTHGLFFPGTRVPKPPISRGVTPQRSETIAMRREWWASDSVAPAITDVDWIPLLRRPDGLSVKVGEAVSDVAPPLGPDLYPANLLPDVQWRLMWASHSVMARVDGRLSTLADRTLGYCGAAFGRVLYVSREGWLVVTVGTSGLAWLEPIAPGMIEGRTPSISIPATASPWSPETL